MTDTIRSPSSLIQTQFRDGQAQGAISPQTLRDLIVSLEMTPVNIQRYGAIGDAALSGNTWSGTDNTPFLTTALAQAVATGRPLYIPTGKYFLNSGNPLNMSGTISQGLTIFGDGLDQSFLVYLDSSPCIGTPNQGTARMPFLNLHDFGVIGPGQALTVQGSWNAIQLQDVDKVVIKNVSVDRSAVMCMSGRHSKDVLIEDCRLTNSYRDGINFDASYIRVIGNHLNHIGDDGIACTSMTGDAGDFPARDGIVVSGNTMSDSNGIVCISARGASITGNTGNRIKGRFIVIGNSTNNEGATPAHGVNIVGNVCRDMITYNTVNPYFINLASTNPRIGSNPVTAAIPGFPSSAGEMVSPYPYLRNNTTDQTVPMPPGYAFNVVGNTFATTLPFSTIASVTSNTTAQFAAGVTSITVVSAAGVSNGFTVSGGNIAQGTTATVSGNTITLSLPTVGIVLNAVPITFTDPSVLMFSSLGWGLVITNHGFMDVPLTAVSVRSTQALFFTQESPAGIIQGINFTGNMISGVQYGIYIKPGVQVIDCLISHNVWRDILGNGVVTIASPSAFNRITIDGDIWDGDPYFQGTHRNVIGTGGDGGNEYDGTWTTTSGATPVFSLSSVNGLTVKNSTFRNWATLYSSKPAGTIWENNTLVCNPVAAGGFNAGNAGISSLPTPTSDLKYKIEDSNPSSATYGQLLNDCPTAALAVPASGTWVAGTVVTNNAVTNTKSLAGNQSVPIQWLRQTTGSGNVLNTDWFPVYAAPNSIPRVIVSGAVAVGATDFMVVVNKTVGSATAASLLTTPVTGMQVIIKDGKGDAATNNITITPAAGNIDGAGTSVINTNFGAQWLMYNGTQWNIILKM